MRYLKRLVFPLLGLLLAAGCERGNLIDFPAGHRCIAISGRHELRPDGTISLITSASSVSFRFSGDSCSVRLKNEAPGGDYNYAVLELDGRYLGRYRITGTGETMIPVWPEGGREFHLLRIIKATEAQNGNILFCGVTCRALKDPGEKPTRSIEFIGNSITCAMGCDTGEKPCGSGPWYDQHNAYFSYASILGRTLGVNVMLSSVSGIGIYRTWNREKPSMPDVYERLELGADSSKRWDFSKFSPDIISICLGTNDISNGDGLEKRASFSSDIYTGHYIEFVSRIHSIHPSARIVLLSSPMLETGKSEILENCLHRIHDHFEQTDPGLVSLFFFDALYASGCSGHPDISEQQQIAGQLVPFFTAMLTL